MTHKPVYLKFGGLGLTFITAGELDKVVVQCASGAQCYSELFSSFTVYLIFFWPLYLKAALHFLSTVAQVCVSQKGVSFMLYWFDCFVALTSTAPGHNSQ